MVFVVCLLVIGNVFIVPKATENAQAVSNPLLFDENTIKNQEDIISADEYKYFSGVSHSTNEAPFDNATGQQKTGYVYTPNADEFNQVDVSLVVNSFQASASKSVYVWIYIPDDYISALSLTLYTASGEIAKWEFSSSVLTLILENAKIDSLFGWKLFEFSFADATLKVSTDNLENQTINSVKLVYANDNGMVKKYSNNKLSFYHMFLGDSVSNESKIVKAQNLVAFKFNSTFANSQFFLNDKILINSEQDVFSLLVVGKYNLLEVTNPNYSWKITISQEHLSAVQEIAMGESFYLKNKGWLNINFILSEQLIDFAENIFGKQIQFYVGEFVLGSFQNSALKVNKGESKVFVFYFAKAFDYEKNFVATLSDKKIAKITNYYVKDGVGYVAVTGLKTGKINLSVQAEGKRKSTDLPAETLEVSKILQVVGEKDNKVQIIIMWSICGIYCVSLLIYVVILFVKARRFGVK